MNIINNTTANNPYLQNTTTEETKTKQIFDAYKSSDSDSSESISFLENSSFKVSLSMNAQIILFSMNAQQLQEDNTTAQKDIMDFLSGKTLSDGSSLADIGYEGKPITQLSQSEAKDLVSEDGFFGITQTSDRIANFALSFSDDPDIIRQALEGVKQGFEKAESMWGGNLPDISYQTRDRTLELINNRLAELEGTATTSES